MEKFINHFRNISNQNKYYMKEETKKKKFNFWKTVKVISLVTIGVAAGVVLQKKFDVAGVVGKIASKKKDAPTPKVETKPAPTATPTYSNNNGWNKNRRYYRYNNN